MTNENKKMTPKQAIEYLAKNGYKISEYALKQQRNRAKKTKNILYIKHNYDNQTSVYYTKNDLDIFLMAFKKKFK